ncbi:unnamed protein product [Zymoseptoria tritici ST99CH_1A5]|uniref:BTB domain-containing protein n=2 Tax=Zymoseptoria tritici TaxID=1047171 RepID=A0A1X7S9B4_ZYMT9|nr:unnamed protein product [Zymoseptoria tritici ST99CH_3D7]SMY29904.1 unnamed protein product [Zymoseptoria tritici ST99CH_1A5]
MNSAATEFAAAGEPTPNALPELDYTTLIQVLAGPEEALCFVHQQKICAKSPFFVAACSKDWKEGKQKVVRLPTIKHEIVTIYIHWVYTGEFVTQIKPSAGQDNDQNTALYRRHIDVYLAAQYLLDDALRNEVISSLWHRLPGTQPLPAKELVTIVWKETAHGCGLQRLLVDVMARWMPQDSSSQDSVKDHCLEFVRSLAVRLLEVREQPTYAYNPSVVGLCYYQDHEKVEKCG